MTEQTCLPPRGRPPTRWSPDRRFARSWTTCTIGASRPAGGGRGRIDRQHEQQKLTARERLGLLIDAGTFTELGIHGRPHFSQRAMEGKQAPADGVITGYGKVDGRLVAVAAYDFTVMAGSMGMTGEMKVARLRELALGKRIPMIWLLDSAGPASRRRPARCSPARDISFARRS